MNSQIDIEEPFGVEQTQETVQVAAEEPFGVEQTQETVQVAAEEHHEIEQTQETSVPEEIGVAAEEPPRVEQTHAQEANETDELVTVTGSEDEKREASVPKNTEETEVDALNNNKVDVDIEPDVKSNDVKINLCSLSCIFNCFSGNRRANEK